MRLQTNIITHKQGQICPSCASTDAIKSKGILITKDGKYGIFLSCSRFPDCKYACNAAKSDKRKHKGKKTRRGKKRKKANDSNWSKKVEEAMRQHQKEKTIRAQLSQHIASVSFLIEKD